MICSIIFLYFKCNVLSSTMLFEMTHIFNIYNFTLKEVKEYDPHFTGDKV